MIFGWCQISPSLACWGRMGTTMTNSKNSGQDRDLLSGPLGTVLRALLDAGAQISRAVVTADTGVAGTTNVYGEEQIKMDVLCEKILEEHLAKTGLVAAVGSEELDGLKMMGGHGDGKAWDGADGGKNFIVVYDPLDGSSLFDTNGAVGTIWGVFENHDAGDDLSLLGKTPGDMVAAGYFLYGPRTTLMVARSGEQAGEGGVSEYRLMPSGEWVCSMEQVKIGEGKMFAPGNLRATKFRPDYLKLVNWWMEQQYTLRYSGGMVPDINSILIKGKGIFSYPGYEPDAPDGKLRLVFECGPMAYLMERAGGAASDGEQSILTKKIDSLSQRTPIYIGSKEEVKRCEEWLS